VLSELRHYPADDPYLDAPLTTAESASLVSGHRFPRDIVLLAVRYYGVESRAGAVLDAVQHVERDFVCVPPVRGAV